MTSLVDYFMARDGADPVGALNLLAADVRYHLMPAPGVEISGASRAELRTTLEGFPSSQAKHALIDVVSSPSFEFVLGHRTLDGKAIGTFIAVGHTAEDGQIVQYIGSYFDGLTVED